MYTSLIVHTWLPACFVHDDYDDLLHVQVAYQGSRLPLNILHHDRCPPKLARLLKACWETDPARRPAAAEAAKELTVLLLEVSRRMRDRSDRCDMNCGRARDGGTYMYVKLLELT